MPPGHIISGAAHAALLVWVLAGPVFQAAPPEIAVANVTVVSAREFAALTPSERDPEPEPQPEPAPEVAAPPVAPPPAPEPEPALPGPEQTLIPEQDIAVDAPPAPGPAVPETADRIAPDIAPEPAPEAAPGEVEQAPSAPDPDAAPETQEAQEETAPEAAATEITTEAEAPSRAPLTSFRPPSRPDAPQLADADDPPQADPEAAADPLQDDVLAALQEAQQTEAPAAPSGPPLTEGERDALRVAVSNCWNVGALSTEGLGTTVVVAVELLEDGKPNAGSVRLVASEGGTDASARQAFETARRAIIRCGARGFDLPADKYEHWKEIEMTFNPENMRVK